MKANGPKKRMAHREYVTPLALVARDDRCCKQIPPNNDLFGGICLIGADRWNRTTDLTIMSRSL